MNAINSGRVNRIEDKIEKLLSAVLRQSKQKKKKKKKPANQLAAFALQTLNQVGYFYICQVNSFENGQWLLGN
ncbi:hypothetical protein T4C_13995 [Trichinella pseudospiralis]|uniref:Uncharacterized protein n=1 Tax=Trichinella pseudospiralis TaxID=6337 RepID=A0A0V1JV69_TRIPS|nr:hypothetical protein T4C_13995 [Trichinella pseudospiralis]